MYTTVESSKHRVTLGSLLAELSSKSLIGTRDRKLYLKLREEEDNIINELTCYHKKIEELDPKEMFEPN